MLGKQICKALQGIVDWWFTGLRWWAWNCWLMIYMLTVMSLELLIGDLQAYCDELEETVHSLRRSLRDRDTEIDILKDELALYKNQVTMLSNALR